MIAGRDGNPQKNAGWLLSKEEKEKLVEDFIGVYQQDLRGNIMEEDKRNRVAQKHVALSLMRELAKSENLWVLPIGRYYKKPVLIRPYMSSDFTDQKKEYLSRFQAVIVYDKNSGGMCVFDVGSNGCQLTHSAEQYSRACKENAAFLNSSSYKIGKNLLDGAEKDLKDAVHTNFYPGFVNDFLLQASTISRTSTTIVQQGFSQQLRTKDEIRIISGVVDGNLTLGWAPLLPEDTNLTLSFGPPECHYRLYISSRALQPLILAGAIKALEKDSPAHVRCLLSGDLLKDPVVTPQGTTYEREAIEKWIANNHSDPQTKRPLQISELVPNKNLRLEINSWLSKHGAYPTLAVTPSFTLFRGGVQQMVREGEIPKHLSCLCCYLNRNLMSDPVMTPEGTSYERSEITAYIAEHGTDPITALPLRVAELIPNRNLKDAIEFYNFQSLVERLKFT